MRVAAIQPTATEDRAAGRARAELLVGEERSLLRVGERRGAPPRRGAGPAAPVEA